MEKDWAQFNFLRIFFSNRSIHRILLSLVLLCVLWNAGLVYATSVELMPYSDGTYVHDFYYGGDGPFDYKYIESGIHLSYSTIGGSSPVYFQGYGIVEFDISGVNSLFSKGQMKATLTLVLKSKYANTTSFCINEILDQTENGIIEVNESFSQISCIPFLDGTTFTIDVTTALEHDLFTPGHTAFSGFLLSWQSWPNHSFADFYDHTDPVNAPRLIISSSTLITLAYFKATPQSNKSVIEWLTESEIDNAGFNIYRAEAEDGKYVKINSSMITAQGSATQGASYEYIDKDVQNRKTYYYKLEDIDLNGKSTMHGPVSSMPRLIYGIGK
jgi:hypothetical protein